MSQFVNKNITPEEIVSIFFTEGLEPFIRVARLESRCLSLRLCRGGCTSMAGELECPGDLLKRVRSISHASIDRSSKFAPALRKTILPGLTFDPHSTHGTLVDAGHLKRLSHMAGRTRLR